MANEPKPSTSPIILNYVNCRIYTNQGRLSFRLALENIKQSIEFSLISSLKQTVNHIFNYYNQVTNIKHHFIKHL